MSIARSLSKLINKDNYIAHFGESSVADLSPTETDVAAEISSNPIPAFVGIIGAFSMSTTTEWRTTNRWIICDGSAISRTIYSDLFTVVGTTWGVGDGSSTFNLPDLRGEFLRGFDNGLGSDPDSGSRTGGDAVGSSQSSEFGAHTHRPYQTSRVYDNNYNYSGGGRRYGSFGYHYDTTSAGGNETRPRNKYVQYCIKF